MMVVWMRRMVRTDQPRSVAVVGSFFNLIATSSCCSATRATLERSASQKKTGVRGGCRPGSLPALREAPSDRYR